MSAFDWALPWTLAHEGGLVDDPDDPGGRTNLGITQRTLDAWNKKHPEAGSPTRVDDLTPALVAPIYREGYWRFDGLDDAKVAMKLFDMAVNMGLNTAVRLAQEILDDLGASLRIDGVWGPRTEATVNSVRPTEFLDQLCQAQADHYRAIVARRPASAKFLKGWLKRAEAKP